MNKIRSKALSLIYDYIYMPVYFKLVYFRDWKYIADAAGKFEKMNIYDFKKYTLHYKESKNVSGVIIGEIVKIIIDLKLDPKKILLDGDSRNIADQFRERFDFDKADVITAGIDGEYDYIWNFENNYPREIPRDFDLIISQAIFEHLIDPYKHFRDLASLLKKNGGYLIVHTHLPGYTYHRYPIDAVRFFPDWFERSSERNGLKIKRKFMRNFHLIYLFEK